MNLYIKRMRKILNMLTPTQCTNFNDRMLCRINELENTKEDYTPKKYLVECERVLAWCEWVISEPII
jgi:hypothetical protein